MSSGDLQEMEVGTKPSKTAVNANAKPAEPMQSEPGASYEDLGGPTPDNNSPIGDSNKLKEPRIKTVKDIVNAKAKPAEPMEKLKGAIGQSEEVEVTDEVVAEAESPAAEEEKLKKDDDLAGSPNSKKKVKEEAEEEVNVEEDVNALLGGEDLSEEFKEKAKVIFEAALRSKVEEIKESLEKQYEEKLSEEVEVVKESLVERVDSYLEYVSEEWMSENKLAVENGLKTEMTESFLNGMRSLFEEHYVSIPEEKYDVLHNMVEKLDDMETKLNEQIEKNMSLNKRLAESVADSILDQVSEGLAETQKEKLASLSESVEFESEEEYRDKLEMLKESYFPSKTGSPKAVATETLSEGVENVEPETYGSNMNAYLKTLGSFSAKS
jgi:hypothetical protein